jgi:hypothetical protein
MTVETVGDGFELGADGDVGDDEVSERRVQGRQLGAWPIKFLAHF